MSDSTPIRRLNCEGYIIVWLPLNLFMWICTYEYLFTEWDTIDPYMTAFIISPLIMLSIFIETIPRTLIIGNEIIKINFLGRKIYNVSEITRVKKTSLGYKFYINDKIILNVKFSGDIFHIYNEGFYKKIIELAGEKYVPHSIFD